MLMYNNAEIKMLFGLTYEAIDLTLLLQNTFKQGARDYFFNCYNKHSAAVEKRMSQNFRGK